jgi:hypothetical protein
MRIAVALSLWVGCSDGDPDVRVQRQAATVTQATDSAWADGGAVLAGQPGSFDFPQPLALRISIVDSEAIDAEGVPTPLMIESAVLERFGDGVFELVSEPTCTEEACVAELRILGRGSSMLAIRATGPEGTQNDCFYYAIVEDASPDTAGEAMLTELEAQQQDCRASFLK